MPDRRDPDGHRPAPKPLFVERLTVPWWWWPLGLGVATLLAAEVHMGYPGVRAWLPYLLTVPLTCVVLGWMGRHRVQLCGEELRVGPAHVPVQYLGQPEVIYPPGKRRALGPDLDPAAFMLHCAWIGPVIWIPITDPADPTPYWVFSVRQAAELAALLQPNTEDVPNDSSEPHSPSR